MFSIFLSRVTSSVRAGTGFNDKPDLHPSFQNTDWMASIPDETPISAVPIPGTHESLTFSKLKFAGNQVWTLEQQLRVGIRYFDIHAGMWLASENEISIRDDKWMIDQKINLQTVIEQIRSFLRSHKKEAVVLKLTLHGRQQDKVAALIKKLFGKFENVLWREKGIPTMEKVRGKIVLLDSGKLHFGIQNKDSKFFQSNKLVNVEGKIESMKLDFCDRNIVVTENPTTRPQDTKEAAKKINQHLSEFLQRHKISSSNQGCLGIISMDFPSPELIEKIIHLKPCDCGQKSGAGSKRPHDSSSQTEETKLPTDSGSPTTSSMVTLQPATEEQPKPQPQTSITPTTAQEPTTTTPQSNGQTMKKDENEKYPPSPPNVLPGKPKLLTETRLDNTDWMTSVPDETPLSTITVVGIRLLFGKKQVWTMKQKLKDGIRYFDINVGVWRATEKEYHIRSTKWMVEEVLLPISIFLRIHSHETVLLRLTIHGRTKTIVDDFTNTSTEKFKDIMWTKRSVPTMKEARGKIVFLKTKSFHFGAENHKSKILDLNMLTNFEKNIELQKSHICGDQLVVTESLASDQYSLEQITKFVQKYISGFSGFGCFGIISMDDPSPVLIEKIIHLKPCNCGQKLEIGSKKPHEFSSQTEETKVETNGGAPSETVLDNTDWMTSVPDETPLSTITVVGIRLLFGKKQVWTMKQKLKDGIRYFDINVGVWRATEKEYHIRSTKWMVEEVLLPISIFLNTHSHETVFLRLTIHGRTKTIVDDFTNTSTEKFKDIMWTKQSVPTMKEARGKIVFLKTKSFHFGAENHKSKILDLNMLTNFEKNIELQKSHICGGQLVVTESLASDQYSLEQLTKFVQKYISGYSDFGCLGIISMDDPSPELIEKIIHLKPCNCGQKLEIGSKRPHDSSSQTEETKLPTDSGSPTTFSMVTLQPATEEQPKPQPQTSITPTTAQEPTTTTTPQSNGQTMKKDENEKYPPSPPNVLPGKPKLQTETGLDNTDWMTSIPDETALSTITIVGVRLLFGKKQVWTMKQKLKDGIRYFDINVGVWRATEKEFHIRSTKWMVEEVLFPISIFLRTHSHETVLLRLTIHGRTKTIVDDFTNTSTEKFKDIMWTKRSVPTMKEARGKIVFLKTKSFHFGAENHKSIILDSNMLTNFEKNIELQKSEICGGQLVVTESLASDQESLEQITKFVQKYISGSSGFGCLGIISMDDLQSELINSIVHLRPCDCNQTGGQLHSNHSTNTAKIKPLSLPSLLDPHLIYLPMVSSMSHPIPEPQLVFRKCRRG
ncbi:uncharacterized protein LOC110015950 [Oryzias latipes]|uniref:uncharacterized protein LOC110015950 n=1 Tax=Oryzias latipes TaxID=8090 RepID=UPI000CE20F50|nr:uncharacterized protein LOC110015950 [Oryzias latipes]